MRRHLTFVRTCMAISALTALVGARPAPPVIRLSDYCTDPTAADHTVCIGQWIAQGQASPGRRLRADAGTYRYAAAATIYSGLDLECAGATLTTFRNIAGNGTFLEATSAVNDVHVRGCGFDVNGNPSEFLAVIAINATSESSDIRVERNRFFDNTLGAATSAMQRQYIALLNCNDCRVMHNYLAGGGRIKVGRPGRELEIKQNVVEFANDNAITVVDINPTGLSYQINIERNQIRMPKGVGIFLGADGQTLSAVGMTTRNVRVRRNDVRGDWTTACVQATLPGTAHDIEITDNVCTKTGPTVLYAAGISVIRTDDAVAPSSHVRVINNRVTTTVASGTTALDYGGIFVNGLHDRMTIRSNTIVNVSTRAIYIRGNVTNARIGPNTLSGGTLQITGTVTGDVVP